MASASEKRMTGEAPHSLHELVADVLYGGLDPSVPGVGGPECQRHLPLSIKIAEAVLVIFYSTLLYVWTHRTLTPIRSEAVEEMRRREDEVGGVGKKIALVSLCLVFGMELTYKIVTRQLLFVLNPCHAVTVIQIYLLCVRPSKSNAAVFRVMLHNLFGALIAVLFSVTNTRELPGEIPIYWIQHVLILCVPAYIIYLWGPLSVENLFDWSWARVGLLAFGHYHHHFLHPIAELTYVNLNCMLCPMPSDPIGGHYYRAVLIIIMTACVMTIGKLYAALTKLILRMPQTVHRISIEANGEKRSDERKKRN